MIRSMDNPIMKTVALFIDDAAAARLALQPLMQSQAAGRLILVACAPKLTRHVGRFVSNAGREQYRQRWARDLFTELQPLWSVAPRGTVETMVAMISAARQFEAQMRMLQTAENNEKTAAQLLETFGDLDTRAVAELLPQLCPRREAPGVGGDLGLIVEHKIGMGAGQIVRQGAGVCIGETAQYQLVDVHQDAGHDHPRTSASAKGLSRLAASRRAAWRSKGMVTGVPASAARKAAARAMLRMLPPARLRRASLL